MWQEEENFEALKRCYSFFVFMKELLIFFLREFREEQCEDLVKSAEPIELNLVSDIKRDKPKFGTVFTQTRASYDENA